MNDTPPPTRTTRERASPLTGRPAIVRAAADVVGVRGLMRELDVSERAVFRWIDGTNAVSDSVLRDIHRVMTHQRQRLAAIVRLCKMELGDEDR